MSDTSSVESIFFTALEERDAAARAVYLDSACEEDGEVRRQVEKMLRAHSKVGLFMTHSAIVQFADSLNLPDFTQTPAAASAVQDGEDSALDFLQPSSRPDALGRIGHYLVLEVLGKGGFGIVFRAFDETLQRVVAVKMLAPQLSATATARQHFVAEARLSARVRHANVVQVYAVEDQVLPYLVMELIPGETLQERLNRTGPLGALEVATIGLQIANGLAAAHSIGLIHRDVKPENILLESGSGDRCGEAHVKLSDFGLARAADDVGMSQYGIVAGTPMFMAPEQALGETLDFRADLFSLGSVLYTMCCGHPPFRGKSTYAVLRQVVEEDTQPVRDVVPDTPEWLCEIITRLHAKQPEDRFASATEVASLLGLHLARMQYPGSIPAVPDAERNVEERVPVRNFPAAPLAVQKRMGSTQRWVATLVLLLVLIGGLGFTEATGVTNFRGTVIRLFSAEGTLVIEVDDPGVSVRIDGSELVITGTGAREIRLKPGEYEVEARKGGRVVTRELVTVTHNGRQTVRVSLESSGAQETLSTDTANMKMDAEPADAWERAVAALNTAEQAEAVVARLMVLNPGFDGSYLDEQGFFDLQLTDPELQDISPVRAMRGLQSLLIRSDRFSDLSALKGLKLTYLGLYCELLTDLSPLGGMSLRHFDLSGSKSVSDLSPLRGMPLADLSIAYTRVDDLTPLIDMQLDVLNCDSSMVTDLSPLKGMPLTTLMIHYTMVSDLSPLRGMPLRHLNCINSKVNDAALTALSECPHLTVLRLTGTKVTAAGIDQLNKSLPGCRIEWDGGVVEPR